MKKPRHVATVGLEAGYKAAKDGSPRSRGCRNHAGIPALYPSFLRRQESISEFGAASGGRLVQCVITQVLHIGPAHQRKTFG